MEELHNAISENLKYQKKIKRRKYTKPFLFNIIDDFISSRELICYGGIAINTIIPKERFYDEVDIPDYDCFSNNAIEDAKELADILSKYENVEVKSAIFKGTYKIFVNFIPMLDFTQIEHNLFKKIKYESLKINNIYYAPPNYLRMNIHLELSRPLGDVSRWEKIYHRLELLNKYHPFIYNKNIVVKEVRQTELYNEITEKCKKWVILGEYAMKYLNLPKKYNVTNSNIFILSESLNEVKKELSNYDYKIISYSNKFINNFYEFKFNEESLLYVFITNSCQSYDEIKEKGDKGDKGDKSKGNKNKIKIANVDTMLMIYYALSFIHPESLNINNLLVYCYLLQNTSNRLSRFKLPCIGNQPTFEDIRRERDNMYKLYQKTKSKAYSKKIYKDYFFHYVPKQTRKRI